MMNEAAKIKKILFIEKFIVGIFRNRDSSTVFSNQFPLPTDGNPM